MNTEPALALGAALTALAQATFLILRAAGIGITQDLENGVIAFITALLMFPLLTGYLIRFFVFAPDTVDEEVEMAYEDGFAEGSTFEGNVVRVV